MFSHAVTFKPVATDFTVSNLTRHDFEVSSRLLGGRLHIIISEKRHGAIVAPDTGIFIPEIGEVSYGQGV